MSHASPFHTTGRTTSAIGGRHAWPRLGLHISERRLVLAFADLIIINVALFIVLWTRGHFVSGLGGIWEIVPWFLLLSVIWLICSVYTDIYNLARAASPLHSLWAAVGCVVVTGAVYILIPLITPGLPERRLEIAIFAVVAVGGVASWRVFYAKVLAQPQFYRTALVIGAGGAACALAEIINEMKDVPGNPIRGTGYRILGFVDDDPAKQGQLIETIPVLGTRANLLHLAQTLQPDELVIAITDTERIHAGLFNAIMECQQIGIPITTMTSLFERMTGRVPIDHAGYNLEVVLPIERPATFRAYLLCRRLVDIGVAAIGCLLLGLLMPVIWIANRFLSPGDLFYRQTRVGKGGRHFDVFKFRSMVMNAEKATGAVWACEGDPRITPVGRLLRRTRLDEVPQFWNILWGDMSLIGPRPERPEFVHNLCATIPFYGARHSVRPGLTGWAQVKYRYASSENDTRRKLEFDLYYIKHQGLFLDFVIILKTAQVVLGMAGR